MPSIRQLAEIAGVSHMTVVRALRDDSCVKPETRMRIKALAEEYHYRPNRMATSLWTGNSRVIGCLVPHLGIPFCARIMRGVLEAADELGLHVISGETRQSMDTILMRLHGLVEQRVDGVILFGGVIETLPKSILLELWSNDITPVVLDAMACEGPVCRVVGNGKQMAEAVVTYLMTLGHRHIAALVGGARDDESSSWWLLRHALIAHGLDASCLYDDREFTDPELVLQQLCTGKRQRPTALIVWGSCGDGFAIQILKAALTHNIPIPQALSIVGSGNDVTCSSAFPELTSIEGCPEELGRQAVLVIHTRRAAGLAPQEGVTYTLAGMPYIVERESCAPLAEQRRMRCASPTSMP